MADQMVTNHIEQDEREDMPQVEQERPRSKVWWVVLVVAVVIAAVMIPIYGYYSVRESTDDAQVEAHIHPVAARITGTVTQVLVENNQYVQAGTVLVQIDPRDYQNALAQAQGDLSEQDALWRASQADVPVTSGTTSSRLSGTEAEVQEAEANVAAAQKEAEAARAKLAAAQASLREATANAQKASKDLDRMKPLAAKDEISQQQYDAFAATAESMNAAEDAARASIADAEAGVQTADSHVAVEKAGLVQAQATVLGAQTAPQQVEAMKARADSAHAKLEEAKASTDQAQLNLQYTTIRAPISGVVSKRAVEVGQTVQAGQPLLAIVDLDHIWITADFKETQLRDMRPGQSATISVDAYGGREYKGHIESIAGATGAQFSLLPPENASGNYVKVVQRVPVKILLEQGQDPQHLLRPGMSVEPTVLTR